MIKFSEISSNSNKYIKLVEKLQKSSKARNESGLFVLEGLRICEDAFDNGIVIENVFVSVSFYEKTRDIAKKFFQGSKLNFVVNDSLFLKICDTKTPQGIIVVAKKPDSSDSIDNNGKYIALDSIADTSNLGAICRTAEALGLSGIIINNTSCDPYSPKSLRASMGTLLRMPVFITDDLPAFLTQNGLSGVSLVVDKTAQKLDNFNFEQGDVIIIGNEANGIGNEVKTASRALVTIPMSGKTESLNAAGAAAIAIYEYTKQR